MAHLRDRYRLAPQMEDYDSIPSTWLPYLMYFQPPNISLKHVSTDANGFRRTKGGNPNGKRVVLLGGSTAFGVGATGDERTIPSLLNQQKNWHWLNYGGRAFNSSQELILFLTFPPYPLDHLVIFSGANNLALSLINRSKIGNFLPFYNMSRFNKSMALEHEEQLGIKYRFNQLMAEIGQKIYRINKKVEIKDEVDTTVVLSHFKRDLETLSLLGKAKGFQVTYVLQPFASWIQKELTEEEKELFAILDECSTFDWMDFDKVRNLKVREYVEGVGSVCQDLGIDFLDLNNDINFKKKEWLFVDRVHLTDLGYQYAAKALEGLIRG